ncbi:nuclear RNA export factor 1-like [Gouania willdenowi]|uniref:nuclear RNA export factor 1-like n=1 Tax=Gouania willdenowi TaxID=441366 RepID=UPI0010543A75|nr:nuclear RNA export factor 1-like [Gouania willdenowi]
MANYNEDNDRFAPQHFGKGRGPYRGRSFHRDQQRGNHRGGCGGPGVWSRLGLNRDVAMSDSSQNGSSHQRYIPYGRVFSKGDGCMDRDWPQGTGGGGGRGGGGRGRGSFRGGIRSRLGWFKITTPHGKKYDNNKCSRKVTVCDGYKVDVHVNRSDPPKFCLSELKVEELEHLKQCMSKRFDSSQQAWDLTSFHTDPDLVSQDIKVVLHRKTNMEALIKIIEENIPQLTSLNLSHNCIQRLDELSELVTKVPHLKALNLSHNDLKTEHELDKLKGLKLVELWLVRNPLCDLFKDRSSYVSAVCQKFPQLLKLDGNDLPPHNGFDVDTPTTLPPCKGSCFGSDDAKVYIQHFLQQYYSVYDSGDRQSLLGAYHDEALFSLTTPYNIQNSSGSSLREYFKDSRNLKRTKDSTMRFRLLKHRRLNVVALLNELPKTQHDISSFTVDVNAYTNTLLSFTVGGVFKEVVIDDKSKESIKAFSRVFITVPAVDSGLSIINDQLFIRLATTEQISRAFVAPAPTPSSNPVPTLTAPQQEMLSTFSLKSGMKLEWSLKCLQDNEWDLNQAALIFTKLKTAGKIPDVAFLK